MMNREDGRWILIQPLLTWLTMLALAGVSLGYALLPRAPSKLIVALAVTIAQASLVLVLFMRLGRASTLVKMTALTGTVWLSFLFLMSFTDLLTR